MSEQQVLPELDEIAKQEIYEAKDSAFRTDDLYSELDKVRAVLHCRERQLRTTLALLAQSEAERERLQAEVVSAKAGESLQSGHLWNAYQASGQTSAMTFSGWINWNIIEREKAEAELARERELNQGLREVVKSYRRSWQRHENCVVDITEDDEGEDRCDVCIKADALLEDKAKPVATNAG